MSGNSPKLAKPATDSEISADGTVIWKGEPLTKISQIEDVARHCQAHLKGGGASDDGGPLLGVVELLLIAEAAKQKLPPEEELLLLRPDVPPPPTPPTERRPTFGKRANGRMLPNHPNRRAFDAAVAKWEKEQEDFPKALAEYKSMLPEFERRITRWHELHGEVGISKMRALHKLLRNRIRDLLTGMSSQADSFDLGVEEILPPGSWGRGQLLRILERGGLPVNREIRERMTFLEGLNPTKIFRGVVRRQYRDYLLFMFGPDQPAIVESPFYGNATYVLRSNPLDLCRRTKRELQKHPEASRLIHTDFDNWRQEICRILNLPAPPLATDH
jgi:hypothetical protein